MAKKDDQIREPGEDLTMDAKHAVVEDPIIESAPFDREYTKYKATMTTDATGIIPEIPEVGQQPINVDFTKNTDAENVDDITGEVLGDKGSGGKGGEPGGFGDDFSISDKPEGSEESKAELSKNEKMLMAGVITEASVQVMGIANDFIIDKWLITEESVRGKILEGVADPNVLDFTITYGSNVIGIQEMLRQNKQSIEKSLTFTREEKRRFTELLALVLKDKNIQMKPEWMLLVMVAEKYGLGVYELIKVNKNTQMILDRVNEMAQQARAERNPVASGGGVSVETDPEKQAAAGTHPNKPKTAKSKTAKPAGKDNKPKPPEETAAEGEDPQDKKFNPTVGEIRETGEGERVKRKKRSVNMNDIQDIDYEKVGE